MHPNSYEMYLSGIHDVSFQQQSNFHQYSLPSLNIIQNEGSREISTNRRKKPLRSLTEFLSVPNYRDTTKLCFPAYCRTIILQFKAIVRYRTGLTGCSSKRQEWNERDYYSEKHLRPSACNYSPLAVEGEESQYRSPISSFVSWFLDASWRDTRQQRDHHRWQITLENYRSKEKQNYGQPGWCINASTCVLSPSGWKGGGDSLGFLVHVVAFASALWRINLDAN